MPAPGLTIACRGRRAAASSRLPAERPLGAPEPGSLGSLLENLLPEAAMYVSRALGNVTCMANPMDWRRGHNDLWHWFKHAAPFVAGRALIRPEITGVGSPSEYIALARAICRKAADGDPSTDVRVRERHVYELLVTEYLVWYDPGGGGQGLFLVVKDCGAFGELQTMFPPLDGRSYFDDQVAQGAAAVMH